MRAPGKRTGKETKEQAQRVALALFTSQGFAATSLRQIAEQLGISKAALYYHFASKEDIVQSMVAARGGEAKALLAWARSQKPGPRLLERAVMRWVDATSIDKLHGIRFMNANPGVMRDIGKSAGRGIRDALSAVAKLVAGKGADPTRQLLVRMAFLSINGAVMAARGTPHSDKQIIAAARVMALALLARIRQLPAA